jgi:hypothetical protein
MAPRVPEIDHVCVKIIVNPGDYNYHLNGRSLTIPVNQILEGYDPFERVISSFSIFLFQIFIILTF